MLIHQEQHVAIRGRASLSYAGRYEVNNTSTEQLPNIVGILHDFGRSKGINGSFRR